MSRKTLGYRSKEYLSKTSSLLTKDTSHIEKFFDDLTNSTI